MLDVIKIKFQKLKTLYNLYETLGQPTKELLSAVAQSLIFLIPTVWLEYTRDNKNKTWGSVAQVIVEKLGGNYLIARLMTPNIT